MLLNYLCFNLLLDPVLIDWHGWPWVECDVLGWMDCDHDDLGWIVMTLV